jgi:endonuclease/exonuclease/phosphatase family metal-dependent hydrolase
MRPAAPTLRLLTLNLWNSQGPHRARLLHCARQLAVLSPDLLFLQEVRSGPALDQLAPLREALGVSEVIFEVVDPDSRGGPIGNAILSRYPIVGRAARRLPAPERDRRSVLCAHVQTPAGLWACACTHLSWELEAAAVREEQVQVVDAFLAEQPSQLPRALAGDFNCTPDSDVVRFLCGRSSLGGRSTYWRDAFARVHPHQDGWTWARRNPYLVRHVEPDRRIDFIFVQAPRPDGLAAILDARVVLDEPSEDGVFGSDHFGVFAELQGPELATSSG